jgi:ADP-L-glycero-D-manno-heptose 6-epimerase
MILVTGGAGLIGAAIIKQLNTEGRKDIIVVDNLNHPLKKTNLAALQYATYYDKKDFLEKLPLLENISAIFHQGACSATTETDEVYLQQNNVEYSKVMLHFAIQHHIPFVYASSASVYGDGKLGFSDDRNEYYPINGYARSKLSFDAYVTQLMNTTQPVNKIIGLRYFNVYGFGEGHKEHMSSVVYKFYQSYQQHKTIQLFAGSDKILRDFIAVEDVVKVNFFTMHHKIPNGIYNVGTGKAASFQDLAFVFQQSFNDAIIETIPFPEILKNKYQYFTEAPMEKLQKAGYTNTFQTINEGVHNYINKLLQNG